MVSKRTSGSPRSGELVRRPRAERHPVERSTTELKETGEAGAVAVRPAEGQGFFSFRYAYKEVSLAGGKTHIRSKEHRFEDGKFSSEEFEGTMDGAVYKDAAKQTQDFVTSQVGAMFGFFSAFLPFSTRPKDR